MFPCCAGARSETGAVAEAEPSTARFVRQDKKA
jgi:hypothetical protein